MSSSERCSSGLVGRLFPLNVLDTCRGLPGCLNYIHMRIFCSLIALAGYLFAADIKTVHFPSEDHKTMLVGYLFEPTGSSPHAGIVMLHGRAGAYSSLAKGVYNAATLSKRHNQWGEFWAKRG